MSDNDKGNGSDKPTLNPAAEAVTDPCDVPAGDAEDTPVIDMPSEPKQEHRPESKIALPSTGADEILAASAIASRMKLEPRTLAELGVTSEADLGDEIELERSPIDGACVVAAKKGGIQVCYYCFKPFVYGGSMPEYAPAEIEIAGPDGKNEGGVRCKVHGRCQIRKMQGLPIE